eukprot:127312-Rhodomonas_salina.1
MKCVSGPSHGSSMLHVKSCIPLHVSTGHDIAEPIGVGCYVSSVPNVAYHGCRRVPILSTGHGAGGYLSSRKDCSSSASACRSATPCQYRASLAVSRFAGTAHRTADRHVLCQYRKLHSRLPYWQRVCVSVCVCEREKVPGRAHIELVLPIAKGDPAVRSGITITLGPGGRLSAITQSQSHENLNPDTERTDFDFFLRLAFACAMEWYHLKGQRFSVTPGKKRRRRVRGTEKVRRELVAGEERKQETWGGGRGEEGATGDRDRREAERG